MPDTKREVIPGLTDAPESVFFTSTVIVTVLFSVRIWQEVFVKNSQLTMTIFKGILSLEFYKFDEFHIK